MSSSDANGQTTTMQYDTEGRLTAVIRPTDAEVPLGEPVYPSLTFAYTIPTDSNTVPDLVINAPSTSTAQRQTGSTYLTAYTYLDGLGQTRETQAPAADGSAGRTVTSTRYTDAGHVEGASAPFYNSSAPGSGMVNPALKDLPSFHQTITDWAGRTTEADIEHGDGTTVTVASEQHTYASYWPDKTIATPAAGTPTVTNLDVFGNTTSITQAGTGNWANYRDLTAGDFNGDGNTDLVAVDTTDNTLRRWWGDGRGNLAYGGVVGGGWGSYRDLTAADLTSDGKADLLAINSSTGVLTRWNGDGTGSFSVSIAGGSGWSGYRDLTAADFTSDGHADLLAINTSTGVLTRWNGDGTGGFGSALNGGSGWSGYQDLAAADLTSDGNADLLAINSSTGVLTRWNGTGTGGFGSAITGGSGWSAYTGLALGDDTGDGNADLLALRGTDNVLRRYAGNGAGSFSYAADEANTGEITTAYTYDRQNRLLSITDNNADVTSYTYNWVGQKISSHDPDAGTSSTTYDQNGNVATTTDAAGQVITTDYDTLNRPTTVWAGASGTGAKLQSFTYDTATRGKDRPATSTAYNTSGQPYITSVDGYDPDGRSLGATITIPTVEGALAGSYDTVTNTYDAADHPQTIGYPAVGNGSNTLPSETVTTGYDTLGHAYSISSSLATYISRTLYNNWGPIADRWYGSWGQPLAAHRSYSYDQPQAGSPE